VGNVSPVILIQGLNYTIFAMSYDIHSFVIFKDEKCQFFDAGIDPEVADKHFGITSVVNWTLNVYRCITSNNNNNITVSKRDEIKQCNATVYYSLFQHWIPGCPLNEETVEVALTHWISRDAERDQSCISCQVVEYVVTTLRIQLHVSSVIARMDPVQRTAPVLGGP